MPSSAFVTGDSGLRRAWVGGIGASAVVVLGLYAGSRGLRDFDSALVAYAGASVFASFGLAYRYGMWLSRPPTRLYWRRGWQVFFRRLPVNILQLFPIAWDNLVAQRF